MSSKRYMPIMVLLIVALMCSGCAKLSDTQEDARQSETSDMTSEVQDTSEDNAEYANASEFASNYTSEQPTLSTTATTEGYESAKTTLSYGRNMIFESSIGLYFQNNLDYGDNLGTVSIIEYAESPLGPWIPLCGKPNCDHNNRNCNAYINGSMLGMYNDRLYYTSGGKNVYSMALDGSDHKLSFSISNDYFTGGSYSTGMSDGYIYYTDRSVSADEARLFRISLDEEKATDENIEYVVSNEYIFNGYVDSVPFDGGISITVAESNEDGTQEYTEYIYMFETKELLTPFAEVGASMKYFTDEYIYGRKGVQIYTYNISTREVQELFAFDTEHSCAIFCDGTYFYGEETGSFEGVKQFFVYDMEGNFVGQTDMDVKRGVYGDYQMMYEITEDAVLLTASGIPQYDYVIFKSDIATGEFDIIKVEH